MPRTHKTTSKVHNLEFLHRDRGYRFSDRDPKMVELCHLIHASEMSVSQISSEVARASAGSYRVADSTISNWLNGKTRRPQSFTMNWVGFAIGYELRWIKT